MIDTNKIVDEVVAKYGPKTDDNGKLLIEMAASLALIMYVEAWIDETSEGDKK